MSPVLPDLEELTVLRAGAGRPDLDQLRAGALVLADKPEGRSSFWLVRLMRGLTGVKKVGHAGTLDPFATGLMILLTGKGTRLQDQVMSRDKRYRCRFRLGASSDTQDRTGQVVETKQPRFPTLSQLEQALEKHQGMVDQIPPMFSAISIGGRRLYKMARKGEVIEREPRRVEIHSLELLKWEAPFLDIDLHCGKGFYVRSLARDLGEELGCGALVEELRRTTSGSWSVEDALGPDDLRELLQGMRPPPESKPA